MTQQSKMNPELKVRWNFNIDEAPRGTMEVKERTDKKGKVSITSTFIGSPCLIATKCGKRFVSSILETGRWFGLATDEKPVAWQILDKHPNDLENL